MRPISERTKGIVSSTHVSRCRVRPVLGFPQSLTPAAGDPVPVARGFVEMDSTAEVRSTLDVTVRAPWLSLLPDGTELFVEQGIEVSGGSTEWVALGYFRMDEITQDDWDSTLLITGSDRMAQVKDTDNASATGSIPKNTTHLDFYRALLYGSAVLSWSGVNAGVFPAGTVDQDIIFDYADAATRTIGYQQPLGEDNYFEIMKALAERTGKRLFFDYRGRLNVVTDVVTTKPTPDLTVLAGKGGQLAKVKRQVTRRGVHTAARITGTQETEGDPPWAWRASGGVTVPNPAPNAPSFTGKFGRIVKRFSSPLLTTTGECETAGDTIMAKVQGLPTGLSIEMIPNPALETLDTIRLRWPDNRTSLSGTAPNPGTSANQADETHVVDRLRFPLAGSGRMQVTTRGNFTKVA